MPSSRATSRAHVSDGPSSGSAAAAVSSGVPSAGHFSGSRTSPAPRPAASRTSRSAVSSVRPRSGVEFNWMAATRNARPLSVWCRPAPPGRALAEDSLRPMPSRSVVPWRTARPGRPGVPPERLPPVRGGRPPMERHDAAGELDPHLDPELVGRGDSRNVVDRYRGWREEAIVADLDARRHPFHVAVENWQHDLNIGSVVRNANAFLAAGVHIVGRRRWNRRGAMVTDRYQHVRHHATLEDLAAWAEGEALPLLGIDNLPGALAIDGYALPRRCALLFGQEGPGLSEEARAAVGAVLAIRQFGSTRSINA